MVKIAPVLNISVYASIVELQSLLACFGIPKILVSGNGSGFSTAEFANFLTNKGITHIKIAPYHLRLKRLIERAVRTVKTVLKKVTKGTILERLSHFLINFRSTPSASTGVFQL